MSETIKLMKGLMTLDIEVDDLYESLNFFFPV